MAKKMKPVMVPVQKMPRALWLQLSALHDHPNSFFERPKKPREKRRKYRIYRMVLVAEFRSTESAAQKKLNSVSSGRKRKGVIYWLNEAEPKWRKLFRC